MEINYLSIGLFLLGVVARIFVPWLIKRYRNPEDAQWSWRYVWPQLLAFGIVLLVAPIVASDFETINDLAPVMAYVFGWGVADLGKTLFLDVPDAVRNNGK